MMKTKPMMIKRRGFLQSAAGAAALAAAPQSAAPQVPVALPAGTPSPGTLARETGARPVTGSAARVVERPGSDHMVDILKSFGIEYIAANPGSSFEGLHESIINYGGNSAPELLTCCHEESSVAMAHGYAKIEGKPMATMLHGVIGIQHAAMAIYNAYADRVPIFMIAGLDNDGPVPSHNASDMGALARDYVKWDHQPDSISQFAASATRAMKLCVTPPMAPVLLVLDARIQKQPLSAPIPVTKLSLPQPPSGDAAAVKEVARQLVAAENLKINAGKCARTQQGIALLVELAELLQAPVNNVGGERVNFPSMHPLAGTGAGTADLTLNLETPVGGRGAPSTGKTISISAAELLATHNFNVNGSPGNADYSIAADAEATLPSLVEEVRRAITPDRKRAFEARRAKHTEANRQVREQSIELARFGWDSSPISLARLTVELWALVKDEDWSLVSPQGFIGNWPNRLWKMDKIYHYIGGQGGGGMGYGAPAAVGAALANRKHGRFSINIQTDGDLNYAPAVLWTAAHHRIPLLSIMHNNRGYHQELMYVEQQCSIRNRGADRAHIGTKLWDPDIDYAKLAQSYGVHGEGPISDPKDLNQALKRAIERVKKGDPVMLDVITQPR
jgi:thiamine pyrophosphate-dependent acetolactate synthase large subunit-like protein